MTPKPTDASVASRVYGLLRYAAAHRQPVAASYDGQPRLLCPHVLGRKSGRLQVLCYQCGGSSNSAQPLAPEGGGVWRCLALEKLRKRGNEATAAITDAPERSESWQSNADYVARGVRGDPRGRKSGAGPRVANPR